MRDRANDRQVGGEHYRKSGRRWTHWDVVERHGVGYLEGYATKYIDRWRDKGGVQDLEKADHCVQKLLELYDESVRLPRGIVPVSVLAEFNRDRPVVEAGLMHLLLRWESRGHLEQARRDLADLINIERSPF